MPENNAVLKREYLTNITKIDEQHQQIAFLLEALCQAVIESHIENKIDHRILKLLSDVISVTRDHFNSEQELMKSYHYEKTREHAEEHALLLKEVVSIKDYCEAGDMVFTYRILINIIDDWFLKHILEMDKALGLYLLGKGVI